jgi:two-component system chemotaxis response regulator CheY
MALAQLQEHSSTELVLLDWNMPRMSGIDCLREIRSSPKFEKLPVIMVTAEAEQELVVEAVSAGVTNYIVKPFTPATLEKKIKEIFPG